MASHVLDAHVLLRRKRRLTASHADGDGRGGSWRTSTASVRSSGRKTRSRPVERDATEPRIHSCSCCSASRIHWRQRLSIGAAGVWRLAALGERSGVDGEAWPMDAARVCRARRSEGGEVGGLRNGQWSDTAEADGEAAELDRLDGER